MQTYEVVVGKVIIAKVKMIAILHDIGEYIVEITKPLCNNVSYLIRPLLKGRSLYVMYDESLEKSTYYFLHSKRRIRGLQSYSINIPDLYLTPTLEEGVFEK